MFYVGNGAGINPWPLSSRKYATRDYTPKSISLNKPLDKSIEQLTEAEFSNYWNVCYQGTAMTPWSTLMVLIA
jgi:hypothetical protein